MQPTGNIDSHRRLCTTLAPSRYHPNRNLFSTATGQLVRPCSVVGSLFILTVSPGYVNMSPPQHQMVIDDCNEALKLDTKYIKALNRRATALEALERYVEAIRGKDMFIPSYSSQLNVIRLYGRHNS